MEELKYGGPQLITELQSSHIDVTAMVTTATYSRIDDLELKLDIYLPASPTVGTLPGITFTAVE